MKYSYKALIALLLGCLLIAGGLALAEEIEFDLPAPEGADEVAFELLAPENEIAAEADAAPVDAGPRYLIDETNFPDPTFRGYVAGFDGDGDGALSAEELAAVNNINLWQEENNANGVANMKGLELFPNVMYLDVEHSNLTTLDVTANTKLEVLYCSYSPITSLTIGPGHDALIDIECWETQLTTLDVSGCPGLQHLDVGITPTATLDLRNNKELRYLGIFKTALTGIDLSANAELRAIVATYSEALSTLDISANAKLDVLQIGGTAIKAVDLTANPSLAEAVKTEPLYGEGIAVFDFVETYDYGVKNRNMAQTYRLMIPEDARVTVGGTLAYKLNPVVIALDVPSTVVLYKGWTLQANALMAPGNADTKVTWKSSNKKVATVSSKGKITAKKLGTATITATTDNKLTAKVKIKVTVEPTKLKLNKTGTVKLKKGKKLQLKTKLTPKASAADLIWESSKPKVATVSSKGKVTAKKAGTTTITVKTINGLKAKVKIKVTK